FGVTAADLSQVSYTVSGPSSFGNALAGMLMLVPVLLAGALILFMLRRRASGGDAFSFGKARARTFTSDRPHVTFADIAGAEDATQELREVVDFLQQPRRYTALGARLPRGVLLVGPPGTGKTLIARAVAGEANVSFFSSSGSEFVEMFVGVGASRVRDLFQQAKRNAPCIIFIDEIDAVGRRRGPGQVGTNDEREHTLNQLLVEMDGFDANAGVILIGATNRPDVLDQALLRPGRFDRQVQVPAPDVRGREAILRVHARGKRIADGVDLGGLARATPGFSGADLANVLNEAAILAVRRRKDAIGIGDVEDATDRVLAGPAAESRLMSAREKRVTAYHEAGHALVGRFLDHHDPVHKITIVGRGRAGGYTRFVPAEDRHYHTRSEFEASIASALGGHAAETIVFGEMSTGASNDLERATSLARRMVTEFGMTERLGVVTFGSGGEGGWPGGSPGAGNNYSEKTAQLIDDDVRRIIDQAYDRASQVIVDQREVLDRLAQALLRYETLQGPELERAFSGPATSAEADPMPREHGVRAPVRFAPPVLMPNAAMTIHEAVSANAAAPEK
ncbi:MAG: ATP-dependent zinc metalloprotease FtsH, partial [Chloroflexi bacterium]|nr:ATP-dependent zinc metalloprotease FtsH [Chloroflexota bacterium]